MMMNIDKYILIAMLISLISLLNAAPVKAENAAPAKRYRVAIFSGHSINEYGKGPSGATSFGKRPETYFNDTISVKFEKASTGKIEYLIFKATDNIPLRLRPTIARCVKADACVEIHHDSAQKDDIINKRWNEMEGFSLFYCSGNHFGQESYKLAAAIGANMLKSGFNPNHYHAKKIKGESMNEVNKQLAIYDRDLFVNANAETPSVLIECGCIESPDEEKMLLDENNSNKIFIAISRGVESFLNIQPSIPAAIKKR